MNDLTALPQRLLTLVGDEPDATQSVLVASVEPGIVFASLAARCVPDLCDECTVDIAEGPEAGYRVESPRRPTLTGGLQRLADRAGQAPGQQVRIPFAHPSPAGASDVDGFRGVAVFTWHYRTPSRTDHTLAAVFVDHAVQMILWQRSNSALAAATSYIDHLRVALDTNRHIGAAVGILMNSRRITQEQALGMLRKVSQNSNRKVHDLALDVIDTGWLDPAASTRST